MNSLAFRHFVSLGQEGGICFGLTKRQFNCLLQFCDTGPDFSDLRTLHSMLRSPSHTNPYRPPPLRSRALSSDASFRP
jgi:hypothetical protein